MNILKRILLIIASLLCCTLLAETAAALLLQSFQPSASLVLRADTATLVWTRLPLWPLYEVEVFPVALAEATVATSVKPPLKRYFSWQNHLNIERDFPFPTNWRISARGLLKRPIGNWSDQALLPDLTSRQNASFPSPAKPVLIRSGPILTWTTVPGAVYYEIEFLRDHPENPNGVSPSKHRLYSSREVFVRGYHPDLRAFAGQRLYWRVRALDLAGNSIGVYSDAGVTSVTVAGGQTLRPLIISDYQASNAVSLLYPVYEWIPIQGADTYEIELLRQPPENPDSAAPSKHRIWSGRARGFSLYDDLPRLENGRYYYRVRGLGRNGEPVGLWSIAATFAVDSSIAAHVATFGDSITHGGGAVSYSPSDWEYSYQSYLKFPTYNLGRSSDTTDTSLERFDRDVLPFQPKHLIIMTGTNSVRAGVPAENLIRDLTAIRDKCLLNGIRPIFLTLPPVNPAAISRAFNETTSPHWQELLLPVNAWIREQPYHVDLYPHFADRQGLLPANLAIDGLHYDIAGKKLMAALVNAHWDELSRLW